MTLIERLSNNIITLKMDGQTANAIKTVIHQWLSQVTKHPFLSRSFNYRKESSNLKSNPNKHDIDNFFVDPNYP